MESTKPADLVKESNLPDNISLNFNVTPESQRISRQEMTKLAGDSKNFLPQLQIEQKTESEKSGDATNSGDTPQSLIVKEALKAYKEDGPESALKLMRQDLAAFEKESKLTLKLPADRGGAGFDEETANKITLERSAERWQAVKQALLEQDPHAIEKLKVAYLDNTLQAMSAAGGRYGNLDQYGVSAQNHFESQKTNGSSTMIRELSGQISKEYSSIADPNGRDIDATRIDKRELAQYKAKQQLSWH